MKCQTPVSVVVPFDTDADTQTTQDVPCGKCLICLSNKRGEWIVRLYFEHKYSQGSHFVTLTYDRKHLPKDGKVSKREMQLFMKRLRKHNDTLRYFLVGEYGTKSGRPHYHALIFGNLKTETIRKAWKKGITHIGKVNQRTIAYCTKYVVQLQKDGAFTLMSRKYAIGGLYLSDDMVAWHKEDDRSYCIVEGTKVKLPRFFKDKIWPNVKVNSKATGKSLYVQEVIQYKHKRKRKSIANKNYWEAVKKHRQYMRELKESGIADVKSYMEEQTLAFVSAIKSKVEYTQTL